ncbi:MAG: DUF255 domain-containing protein [Ginsengibacter sp.]
MRGKTAFLFIACFFLFSFAKVNTTSKEKINWLTIEEVQLKAEKESKPVIIDLYTNWCYWCKVMDKKTYNNSKVIEYVNKHFYAVKLNAETKEKLNWNKKEYLYTQSNKVNEFSVYITDGQLSFPTTVIFPDIKKVPAAIPGFLEPKDMEAVLKYFGEGKYKTQNFEEFSKQFKNEW